MERSRLAWGGAVLFLALTLPRLLRHELWRDEAWLWLVIRDHTLVELLGPASPLARSGQGYLFPLLCELASWLWASPVAMQLLHGLVATAAAFVILRWAPWDRTLRVLCVLGYFPFYEYAVISRHYAVGALLLWVACAAVASPGARWSPLVASAALGLACQTTVYAFLVAIAVAAGWWIVGREEPERAPASRPAWVPAAAGALLLAGAVAGALQLHPLPGTVFASAWRFTWERGLALETLAAPWDAFVPLPLPQRAFWNTNLLAAWPRVHALAGVVALLLGLLVVTPRRAALATYLVGGCGLLAFGYVKYVGTMRHKGHWWLLLAAALWLAGPRLLAAARGATWRRRLLLTLFAAHAAAGAYASWMDLVHPFSNARATARLLRERGLDRLPLVAGREVTAAPVALWLDVPFWFPARGAWGRYPDWGPLQREIGDQELRCTARELAQREGSDVVLVLGRLPRPWEEVEPAGERLGGIQPSEDYRLYRLRAERLQATRAAAGCPW